jgi:hypothetical protein
MKYLHALFDHFDASLITVLNAILPPAPMFYKLSQYLHEIIMIWKSASQQISRSCWQSGGPRRIYEQLHASMDSKDLEMFNKSLVSSNSLPSLSVEGMISRVLCHFPRLHIMVEDS